MKSIRETAQAYREETRAWEMETTYEQNEEYLELFEPCELCGDVFVPIKVGVMTIDRCCPACRAEAEGRPVGREQRRARCDRASGVGVSA